MDNSSNSHNANIASQEASSVGDMLPVASRLHVLDWPLQETESLLQVLSLTRRLIAGKLREVQHHIPATSQSYIQASICVLH